MPGKSEARLAISVILLGGVLHLSLAVAVGLVDDEAYYRLWATALDWSYYDHPGMIAWIIAAGRAVAGDSEIGIRLVSVLAYAAAAALTVRMGWLAGGPATGLRAGIAFSLALPVMLLGSFATPDAPLLVFWTMTLWLLMEAERTAQVQGRRALWFWLGAGIAFGLGVMSKFTALFLAPGVLLWLLASPDGRRLLRGPRPWLALAFGAVTMAPLIGWNIAHDFVGLERQFGRIGTETPRGGLTTAALFLGEVWVVPGPLMVVPVLRGAWRAFPGRAALILVSLPLPGFMAWQSFGDVIQPNWLLPIVPVAAVLAAVGAAGAPRLWGWAAGLNLVLGTALLAVAFWPGAPLIGGNGTTNQARGWPEARGRLEAEATRSEAAWIVTTHWALTGQLAWQLRDNMPVWSLTEPKRWIFRGPIPPALCDRPALLVEDLRHPTQAGDSLIRLAQGPVQQVQRRQGDVVIARYRMAMVPGRAACDLTEAGMARAR